MSEIIETYQEEKEIHPAEDQSLAVATVAAVTANGLRVKFDGEDKASQKTYPCNVGAVFSAGDRVLMQKVSGMYVAICPVGNGRYSPRSCSLETYVKKHTEYPSMISAGAVNSISFSENAPSGYLTMGIVSLEISNSNCIVSAPKSDISQSPGGRSSYTVKIANHGSSTASNLSLSVSILYARVI